jgi:hypothetical protein
MAPQDALGPRCHTWEKKISEFRIGALISDSPSARGEAGESVAVSSLCPDYRHAILLTDYNRQISKIKVSAGIVAVAAGVRKKKQEAGQRDLTADGV